MDALTHRLAAALGALLDPANATGNLGLIWDDAKKIHEDYKKRCAELSGEDHYHGREGG